ncbi:hypothetical protein BKA82DRAFT_4235007 [Pisolithus tinctorius]|nr:hypothetical protein BKA82DRAFT_4235007 [Pisolithus tinctorius]
MRLLSNLWILSVRPTCPMLAAFRGTSSEHRTCFLLDSELSHTEYPCPRVTGFNQIPLSRLKSVTYCIRTTLIAAVMRNPSSGRVDIPQVW